MEKYKQCAEKAEAEEREDEIYNKFYEKSKRIGLKEGFRQPCAI